MGLTPAHSDTPPAQGGDREGAEEGEDMEGAGEEEDKEGDTSRPLETLNRLFDGQTALHVATESGQAEVVDLLLQYGASPAIRYPDYRPA